MGVPENGHKACIDEGRRYETSRQAQANRLAVEPEPQCNNAHEHDVEEQDHSVRSQPHTSTSSLLRMSRFHRHTTSSPEGISSMKVLVNDS